LAEPVKPKLVRRKKVTDALNATKNVVRITMFFGILSTAISSAWGQAAFQGEGNVMYSAIRVVGRYRVEAWTGIYERRKA
jgi:hypothetical protein